MPQGDSAAKRSLVKRVLIADDNRTRFNDVVSTLQEAGIEVTIVDDFTKLQDTALYIKPDLLLTNLMLNGNITLGTVKKIHAELARQGTKIVILTKHKSRENITEALKAGASDFVLDPFEPRGLLQRIKYQLQERESYSPDDLRAEPTQVLAGFQLVYDCLRLLAEISDAHQAIFQSLKKIAAMVSSPRVNVVMGNTETNEAQVIATSDDEAMQGRQVDLEKYPEVREVLLNGAIVFIKDVNSNPLVKDAVSKAKDVDINALLVMPIRHRGETLGTLNIRLGKEALAVSDKHLKTFFMISLALGSKVAAKRLMKKLNA